MAARGGLAAFEERVTVGVEEVALAGGHLTGMPAAAMDDAEEGEELRPRAVAVVHGVGVALGVGAEALEEAVDGVVSHVEGAAGEQAAVFGVEDEDEAHQDGEQAAVDVVGIAGERRAEQFALGAFVGRLEAAEEFVERVQDLLGEQDGDGALVFAAALEDGGEPRGVGQRRRAAGDEEQRGSAARIGRPATSAMAATGKVREPEFSFCGARGGGAACRC